MLDATFKANTLLGDGCSSATIQWNIWARDIRLRLNLASGEWQDLAALVATNAVVVHYDEGTPEEGESFPEIIASHEKGAAIRWALAVDDAGKLALQLQGLPMGANAINSKPSLRGEHLSKL